MASLEFHPLESKIIDAQQAMQGQLELAKELGTGRENIARVLELEDLIERNTAARWTVSGRQPVVTRSTVGTPASRGALKVA